QREAAVPHHDGRDAVPAGIRALAVPEDLRVHVRVGVDEPRRDDEAVGGELWVAAAMTAGGRRRPSASISRAPCSLIRPTSAMRSPTMPTSARQPPSPEPSTPVPPRITRPKRTRHLRLPTRLPASHKASSFWPWLQN